MAELLFWIDPRDAKEAVLSGKCLLVRVHGDRHQYRTVHVRERPSPNNAPIEMRKAVSQ